MKKILLLLLMAVVMLTGCENDTPDNNPPVVDGNEQNDHNNMEDNTGPGIEIGDDANTDNGEEEQTCWAPYMVLETPPLLIDDVKGYFEDGVFKREYNIFSGTYTYKGVDYTLKFEWAEVGDEILVGEVFFREEFCQVISVPGNSGKVIIYKYFGEIMNDPVYQICDVKAGTITPMYEDSFWETYVPTDIYVTEDFSAWSMVGHGWVGYDIGNGWIDITDKFDFEAEEGYCSSQETEIVGSKIIVLRRLYPTGAYYYTYDYITGETNVTFLENASYDTNLVDRLYLRVFSREQRYGLTDTDGHLTIVDLVTGHEEKTEFLTDEIRFYAVTDEEYMFLLSDYGYLINKASGRIEAKSEYPFSKDWDENMRIQIIPSDEDFYICVWDESDSNVKYSIYKIEAD